MIEEVQSCESLIFLAILLNLILPKFLKETKTARLYLTPIGLEKIKQLHLKNTTIWETGLN